jgi:signal transduction histidine kinase
MVFAGMVMAGLDGPELAATPAIATLPGPPTIRRDQRRGPPAPDDAGAHGQGWVHGSPELAFAVDAGIGAAASAMLWFRRRWPVGVALATIAPLVLSLSAGVASMAAVYNVSLRRRPGVALVMAGLHQIAIVGYYLLWVSQYPFWAVWLWALTENAALVALGMYVRARRHLLESLRERAEQAEATRHLLAEQARRAERARIAGEMHDVLAHRVSMMALQAGGLEVRPDLPPAEIRQTAGLIRSTARQALEELRDIIGVLHDGDSAGSGAARAPQPALADITQLVDESRRAGMAVELDMRVETPEAAPAALGRDTYRIVREALTNVSKHARGAAATVSVSGRPGHGLHVTVRNRLPLPLPRAAEAPLPGTGMGLAGLAERVTLAGGTLRHGPRPEGDFVVSAWLRWLE